MLEGSQYEIILDNTSEVAETGRDDDDGIPKSAMALASHNSTTHNNASDALREQWKQAARQSPNSVAQGERTGDDPLGARD